ncbi:MAG: hypothetical protein Q8P68_03990 [Candidatus Peregrinibacteria bacterium]|nr:hypothetical protein [Candidatus Peregrinibacteria bacterium]MDZ4245304.1 hypothetical protein [Candidatus Gracilibacteria bacterium]
MKVTTAWENGGEIPQEYTARLGSNDFDGVENIFPGITITGVPEQTRALIYLVYDSEDSDNWCHYAAVGRGEDTTIPEGAISERISALGIKEQTNQAKEVGWTGPYTASKGEYHMLVIAVNLTPEQAIERVAEWTKDNVLALCEEDGVEIDRAEIVGKYTNPKSLELET